MFASIKELFKREEPKIKTFYVSSPHFGNKMVIVKAPDRLTALCSCGSTVWDEDGWNEATEQCKDSVDWWPKESDMVDLRPFFKTKGDPSRPLTVTE